MAVPGIFFLDLFQETKLRNIFERGQISNELMRIGRRGVVVIFNRKIPFQLNKKKDKI